MFSTQQLKKACSSCSFQVRKHPHTDWVTLRETIATKTNKREILLLAAAWSFLKYFAYFLLFLKTMSNFPNFK